MPGISHPIPIGGERRIGARPGRARDALRLRPRLIHRDRPDITPIVAVALIVSRRDERQRLTIRRPGGLALVVVAASDLPGLAAPLPAQRDDEEVAAAVVVVALAVQLVLQLVDHSRVALLAGQCLHIDRIGGRRAIPVILGTYLADEGDAFAVGRPLRVGDPFLGVGQLPRLAARRADQPDLRLAIYPPQKTHGLPAPSFGGSRRPTRRAIEWPGSEASRGAAGIGGHDPDLRAVGIGRFVDRGADEGDGAPIRGKLRVADEGEPVEVFRSDRARRRAPFGRRHGQHPPYAQVSGTADIAHSTACNRLRPGEVASGPAARYDAPVRVQPIER